MKIIILTITAFIGGWALSAPKGNKPPKGEKVLVTIEVSTDLNNWTAVRHVPLTAPDSDRVFYRLAVTPRENIKDQSSRSD